MCLQWCHVRGLLVDNDIPCALLCPPAIRLAQRQNNCRDCRHYAPAEIGVCLLTHEIAPLSSNCCHWNAEIQSGQTALVLGKTVPEALARAHGVESVAQIFEMVESAPELPPGAADGCAHMRIEEMAVPLVYGLPAADWDAALYPAMQSERNTL